MSHIEFGVRYPLKLQDCSDNEGGDSNTIHSVHATLKYIFKPSSIGINQNVSGSLTVASNGEVNVELQREEETEPATVKNSEADIGNSISTTVNEQFKGALLDATKTKSEYVMSYSNGQVILKKLDFAVQHLKHERREAIFGSKAILNAQQQQSLSRVTATVKETLDQSQSQSSSSSQSGNPKPSKIRKLMGK